MKLRILVIDEDPMLCKAFVIGLNSSDWTVDSATNAVNGIEIAGKHPYDILITDIQLSDGRGFSMLRKTRKILPKLVIFVISGQSCVDIYDEDFLREINGFYPKPIGLAMIKKAIQMEYRKHTHSSMSSPQRHEFSYLLPPGIPPSQE